MISTGGIILILLLFKDWRKMLFNDSDFLQTKMNILISVFQMSFNSPC